MRSDEETEPVEGTFYLIHATNKAYLMVDDNGEEYWIPKSQVISISYGRNVTIKERPAQEVTIEIPRWLVEEKGL